MPRLLSQAQYARKAKYSRARITQLVKQRVIILKNDKVDPAQADAAIAANIDRSRREKAEKKIKWPKPPQLEFTGNGFNTEHQKETPQNPFNNGNGGKGYEGKSLTETRRDLTLLKIETENLKKQLTEIDLKLRLGELIERSEVLSLFSYRIQIVKHGLLSFYRSLPPLLVGKDAREISDILKTKTWDLLERFSQKTGILRTIKYESKKRILARRKRTLASAKIDIR
jgi:hypothetical protein